MVKYGEDNMNVQCNRVAGYRMS